ncbi:MAG TPA: hypothetical protein VFJ82_23120 [Longimicrobium sp.]|nr:hypothetical protein [Longimicrobium sp.]
MSTLKEVEAEALKLSPAERILLAKRLLAADEPGPLLDPSDPIYQLGKDPVSGSDLEGTSELDRYLYDRSRL